MFALIAWLHFNPDSAYSILSSTRHTVVTWLQNSSHTTTPQSRFSNQHRLTEGPHHSPVCAASQASRWQSRHCCTSAHQSPVNNASRVGWKRRKGHFPGGTFEGGICASQEYVRKLKTINSKLRKEKVSASQCLTVKRFWETKTLAREEAGYPNTHLTQSRVDLSHQGLRNSSKATLRTDLTHLKGNLKLKRSLAYSRNPSLFLCNVFLVWDVLKILKEIIYSTIDVLANCLYTSIDSLPAETSQTVQSRCHKYNISKLIWHLCKIWQSYPINRFDHDVAVTDNSNGASWAQSSSPRLITVLHQSIHAALPTIAPRAITHYSSLQRNQVPSGILRSAICLLNTSRKCQLTRRVPRRKQQQGCKHHQWVAPYTEIGE